MVKRLALTLVVALILTGASSPVSADGNESDQGSEARWAQSDSPFLRGFADSRVDWMPWGEAAFARARRENRPLYVFIGGFLSELSRTTEKESFAKPETAAFFNGHFVCVLVDREERPDLAAAAQDYLRAVKQLFGWPAHLWLTPDLQPYEGVNYLPPIEEWGQRSLLQFATVAADRWKNDPAACRRAAADNLRRMRASAFALRASADAPANAGDLPQLLFTAAAAWRGKYDPAHGGFGDPPRYPQPELLRFLLQRGGPDRDLALAALRSLATGALRDPADGGFFRYFQDAEGKSPYRQKTLSDQARLVLAFADAQQIHPDAAFAAAMRGALGYVFGHLAHPDGTFANAEDTTGGSLLRDDRSAADAHGLLIAALVRAGEALGDARDADQARRLGLAAQASFVTASGDVRHFAEGDGAPSPSDYLALAFGFRMLNRAAEDGEAGELADRLLANGDQLFFAPGKSYAACPPKPPPGVFVRAPAYLVGEAQPSPESLAVFAAAPQSVAQALEPILAERVADETPAPGDAIFALSILQRRLGE